MECHVQSYLRMHQKQYKKRHLYKRIIKSPTSVRLNPNSVRSRIHQDSFKANSESLSHFGVGLIPSKGVVHLFHLYTTTMIILTILARQRYLMPTLAQCLQLMVVLILQCRQNLCLYTHPLFVYLFYC